MTEHIERFEVEYAKALNLIKSSMKEVYSTRYYGVMTVDIFKKDLLLSAIVPHNPLLVDNLMSNQELTYEDAKNHLCTLPSSQFKEGFVHASNTGTGAANGGTGNSKTDTAMVVAGSQSRHESKRSQRENKRSNKRSKPSTSNASKCYFCQKIEHRIAECRKRKAAEKAERKGKDGEGKKDKKQKKESDQALVATSSAPVRSTDWKLDTCATAHMCNDLGKFH